MLADLDRESRHPSRGPVLSVALHAVILLVLAIEIYRAPRIAPFRLPGTAHGITLLTYYSPGSTRPSATDSPVHEKQTKAAPVHKRPAPETPTPPAPPRADAGSGSTTESGLGEGDIRVALQQHFPYPKPD